MHYQIKPTELKVSEKTTNQPSEQTKVKTTPKMSQDGQTIHCDEGSQRSAFLGV